MQGKEGLLRQRAENSILINERSFGFHAEIARIVLTALQFELPVILPSVVLKITSKSFYLNVYNLFISKQRSHLSAVIFCLWKTMHLRHFK